MIICNNHLSNQWMRGSFPFVTFIFLSSMFHSFNYVHLSSPLMNLFHFILLYIIMLLLMGFWSLSIVHCLYVEVICMVFYLNFRYFNCTGLSKNNTTKDKCRNMVKRKTQWTMPGQPWEGLRGKRQRIFYMWCILFPGFF